MRGPMNVELIKMNRNNLFLFVLTKHAAERQGRHVEQIAVSCDNYNNISEKIKKKPVKLSLSTARRHKRKQELRL